MTDHNYRLKWNEFESNISISFRELRDNQDFFDVSLVCDDSHIQAHKLILSACSPFFKNVLKCHPHHHPLIYLRGVKGQELEQVLNFMYLGEVSVDQEDLNSFLLVAQDLKVKGLTKSKSDPPPPPPPMNNNSKQKIKIASGLTYDQEPVLAANSGQPAPKKRRFLPPPPLQPSPTTAKKAAIVEENGGIDKSNGKDNSKEDHSVEIENKVDSTEQKEVIHENGLQDGHGEIEGEGIGIDDIIEDEEEYELGEWGTQGDNFTGEKIEIPPDMSIEDKKELIKEYIMKHASGMYQCLKCGYESGYNTTIKRHVEARHFSTPGVPCDLCHVICKTSNALTTHKSKFHQPTKQ